MTDQTTSYKHLITATIGCMTLGLLSLTGCAMPFGETPSVETASKLPSDSTEDGEICGQEVCDAVDNDCDGEVDEDLYCLCNEDPFCYGGPLSTRGVGVCQDGQRSCEAGSTHWGTCLDWVGPSAEVCGDGLDNDCNGFIDEVCESCSPAEICGDLIDNDCDGAVDENCDACLDVEVCFNLVDDNCDGAVDEDCGSECWPDEVEVCFAGSGEAGVGICESGMRTCDIQGFWGDCQGYVGAQEEVCGNGVDEDCDGEDIQCDPVEVGVEGDCATVTCPEDAPYPVGCLVEFHGGDHKGCVASKPDNSETFFKEGNRCESGNVTGVLYCSPTQGEGLHEGNCDINKDHKYYPDHRHDCPG